MSGVKPHNKTSTLVVSETSYDIPKGMVESLCGDIEKLTNVLYEIEQTIKVMNCHSFGDCLTKKAHIRAVITEYFVSEADKEQ